jgi:aspartate dehydrogenase
MNNRCRAAPRRETRRASAGAKPRKDGTVSARENKPLRIGIIGYGALGQEMVRTFDRLGEAASVAAVLVRPGRADRDRALNWVTDAAGMIAAAPTVVAECAGHGAVAEYGPALLEAGIDVIVSSVGCLADEATSARLRQAERGGGKVLIPAGAVAGLDGLLAARLAGLRRVRYDSFKPPHAWRGTRAETVIDLDRPDDEQVFFEGTAREAARDYPKNANVAAAVAFAGIGLDRTRVRLISSRRVTDPLGVIEAEGEFGSFRFEVLARASANPKSSALTAHSLVQCARRGLAFPAFHVAPSSE